jgi:hypothetical protein
VPLPKWLISVANAPAGADDIHIGFVGAFANPPRPSGKKPVPHAMTWDGNNEIDGSWTPACTGGETWQGTIFKNGAPRIRYANWTVSGNYLGKIDPADFKIEPIETSSPGGPIESLPAPLRSASLWRNIGVTAIGLAAVAFAISIAISESSRDR